MAAVAALVAALVLGTASLALFAVAACALATLPALAAVTHLERRGSSD